MTDAEKQDLAECLAQKLVPEPTKGPLWTLFGGMWIPRPLDGAFAAAVIEMMRANGWMLSFLATPHVHPPNRAHVRAWFFRDDDKEVGCAEEIEYSFEIAVCLAAKTALKIARKAPQYGWIARACNFKEELALLCSKYSVHLELKLGKNFVPKHIVTCDDKDSNNSAYLGREYPES